MIKVSQSRIKQWRRCHAAHDYRYNQQLQRKVKARPLQFGSLIHEALELKLAGKSPAKLFKEYELNISKVFEEERIENDLDTIVPNAKVILENYVNQYKKDGLKYVAVEKTVSVQLTPSILFEGKLDGIVQETDSKKYWLFERKTCKSMPKEDIRSQDIQTVLYFDVLKKDGFRKRLEGVIWDYVRSKPPAIPEPLKKGGLSKARIDTIPEVYLEAIKKHGLDPDDYSEMLTSLEGKRDSFLRRVKRPISQQVRSIVFKDMISSAKQIEEFGSVWSDRNLTRDCSFCEFNSLCQAELRGLDTDFILKREYEKRKDDKEKVDSEED